MFGRHHPHKNVRLLACKILIIDYLCLLMHIDKGGRALNPNMNRNAMRAGAGRDGDVEGPACAANSRTCGKRV